MVVGCGGGGGVQKGCEEGRMARMVSSGWRCAAPADDVMYTDAFVEEDDAELVVSSRLMPNVRQGRLLDIT